MLSLRQKIAQMLIIGFEGTELHDTHPVREWLAADGLGGILLFDYDLSKQRSGKNIVSKKQVQQLTRQLNECAEHSFAGKQGLSLLIAVDYEGGAVDRFKTIADSVPTVSPEQLAKLPTSERVAMISQMADMLHNLGVNLNFAPVVDLNRSPFAGIIGPLGRCFSIEPEQVTRSALEFVKIFADHGIHCCYKHFPGHGSAVLDTHKDFVDVTDSFSAEELLPYQSLSHGQLPGVMIMTAHVVNRRLDPAGLPATLSRTMLHDLLRKQLGYSGVIVSDDLQMQAISKHYSMEDALALTINAGADMIIYANQLGWTDATTVIDCIEHLVQKKVIEVHRIEQAFQRIKGLKQTQLSIV